MMDLQIMYQNNVNGTAFDVSEIAMSPKWTTKRTGSPASFEFEVLKDQDVIWKHGGIIAVKNGKTGVFYGYIFKITETANGVVRITAYDQTRYLKNKDTYVFTGKRADQITALIAADLGLKIGTLENTGYVIPSLVEDNKTLFDIILKALDLTLINTGQMFFLWDDYGSLRISSCAGSKLDLLVGDESLATDYTYTSEIDSDTYNRIKLVRDNKETGKRDVYLFQDSNNIKFWGTLQYFEKVDEKMNAAQITERGNNLLALKNRPQRTFEVKALSDLSVRAGRVLFISFADIGVKQFFLIDEASHDLEKEIMSLKLRVV